MKVKNRLLKQINETPGITHKELCELILTTKGNISIHLKNLENEKLIKKYIVEENKKRFRFHPTKKGKDLYLETEWGLFIKKFIE
ncbi:MAG: MarR family winged helix-turn-helix transcriptional regulator [Cetobacterium sp.]|uniref:MarR family winged helix-turn-helix transcriptional regulator n=1 Tax=Cetobacterium sp. TaxID=2071632 RepID=UPI003F3B9D0A